MVRYALPIIINLPSKLKSQEKYKNFIVLHSSHSDLSTLAGTKYHERTFLHCNACAWYGLINDVPNKLSKLPALVNSARRGRARERLNAVFTNKCKILENWL